MNLNELKKTVKRFKKCFVDYEGEIYETDDLHELLARQICEQKGWSWRTQFYSAEDFLLKKKGFVKLANYTTKGVQMKYIAIYGGDRHVRKNAELLRELFNLPIEEY